MEIRDIRDTKTKEETAFVTSNSNEHTEEKKKERKQTKQEEERKRKARVCDKMMCKSVFSSPSF